MSVEEAQAADYLKAGNLSGDDCCMTSFVRRPAGKIRHGIQD